MRVLLVLHRLSQGGGTETHVMTLAQELRRKGHKVGIFTLGGPCAFKAKRFARVQVKPWPGAWDCFTEFDSPPKCAGHCLFSQRCQYALRGYGTINSETAYERGRTLH